MITYTHSSHWDPTDTFRFIHYPDHLISDLGNLLCADRVLVVSKYFQNVLFNNVGKLSQSIAQDLDVRIRIVGLPLNTELLDKQKVDSSFDNTTNQKEKG